MRKAVIAPATSTPSTPPISSATTATTAAATAIQIIIGGFAARLKL
jgi:hypothetical protein